MAEGVGTGVSTAPSPAGLELRASPLLQTEASEPGYASPGLPTAEQSPGRRTSFFRPGPPVGLHGHRVPGSQYAALAAWAVLLLAQYGLMRGVCGLGVPSDCPARGDPVEDLTDVHYLLFTGGLLAVFAGVHWPDRFQYLFSFHWRGKMRGLLFLAAFALSGVGWGLLNEVPGLGSFSLTGLDPANALPMLALAVGTVALVSWHFWVAWRHNSRSGFLAYALSRIALVVLYGAYVLIKMQHEDLDFHFHHYAVAFLAAALAEFNHPLSLLLLACGTGIFVQGVAVYGAAAIIAHKEYHFDFVDSRGDVVRSPPMSAQAASFVERHCWLHESS